jgi:HK97 family phage prohead protease
VRDAELRQVEAILRQHAPSIADQLAIKASAVEVSRRALGLEGPALRRSLLYERELLDASLRAAAGEDVEWPSDGVEYRSTLTVAGPASTPAVDSWDVSTLYGLWCVFDTPTEILDADGAYVEVLRRGAVASAVRAERPPTFLLQHGRHPALGRTPIATIDYLAESERGGWVEGRLVESPLVRDHVVAPARVGLLHASFAFTVDHPAGQVWRRGGGIVVRELLDVTVHDLSATSTPAYPGTSLNVRDRDHWRIVHTPRVPTVEPRGAYADRQARTERQRTMLRLGML